MRNPLPTVDIVIEIPDDRIVFVRRRDPPPGWAFPGGFIEEGESAEQAAIREAREETGLDVRLEALLGVYSDPERDPRHHTLSVVYTGRASGEPIGGDDASIARAFRPDEIPGDLAFDHHRILEDYLRWCRTGEPPEPASLPTRHLDPTSGAWLLAAARSAILEHLGKVPEPADAPPRGPVHDPGAAFVSLHRAGALRGCIGQLGFDRPLHEVVRGAARAAAFEDPRFPPMTLEECHDLHLEISVLSPPWAANADEVIAGLHGVSISCDGRRAIFLPQVARHEGWDRKMLLSELSLKAGLRPDAWMRADARLEAFTAEIFADPTD